MQSFSKGRVLQRSRQKAALKCDTINTNTGGSITPQKVLDVLDRLAWGKKTIQFKVGTNLH